MIHSIQFTRNYFGEIIRPHMVAYADKETNFPQMFLSLYKTDNFITVTTKSGDFVCVTPLQKFLTSGVPTEALITTEVDLEKLPRHRYNFIPYFKHKQNYILAVTLYQNVHKFNNKVARIFATLYLRRKRMTLSYPEAYHLRSVADYYGYNLVMRERRGLPIYHLSLRRKKQSKIISRLQYSSDTPSSVAYKVAIRNAPQIYITSGFKLINNK